MTHTDSATDRSASRPVLDRRTLNRALLERQKLLERSTMGVVEMIEHLVGMQGQEPLQPYYGLWSRIEGFQPESLATLLLNRAVVRAPLLRTTVHLVAARDALTIYPLVRPVLTKTLRSTPFGKGTVGVNLDELCAVGRELLEEQPRTMKALGLLLHERWPGYEPTNLAYAIHYLLPLLQIPPRGVWGQRLQATWTTIEHWLGRPLDSEPSIDELVLRYLAAFGPASNADIRTWSGITGLRAVTERLRPQLVSYRDERGRELFDLPGAPLPDPETPARHVSCRNSTTPCSRTTTAAGSSATSTASGWRRPTAAGCTPTWSTVSWPAPGPSRKRRTRRP